MHRASSCRLGLYWTRGRCLLSGSNRIRPAGTMSSGYVVRRGTSGPPLTYRPFDNAAHGLDPEFRLLNLADMKG